MKKQGKLVITKIHNYIFSMLYDNTNKVIQINCDGSEETILNNIYIGKVTNIVNNINAAFVEFSKGRTGYLPLNDGVEPIYVDIERSNGPLRVGENIIVQVVKEAVGNKEPVLSSNINFVGRFVVFSLKNRGVSFSNKIKWPELKDAISSRYNKLDIKDFGFIIRTNAMHANIDDVFEEIYFFDRLWRATSDLRLYKKCYSLIYKAPKSYITSIRDGYHSEVGQIITDNDDVFSEIHDYLEVYQPDDLNRLRLHDNSVTPLQMLYNVRKEVEDALAEKVWLKSGGYLIIQPTEAFVSIDVNSGKYVSKKDAQKEFLKVNIEAAEEIAHQIRLRNLSGIIIVDFINMMSKESQNALLKAFDQFISEDPVKTTIVDMTKLNLVELTRKKARRPLYELVNKSILLK